jgi:hypothetical protein
LARPVALRAGRAPTTLRTGIPIDTERDGEVPSAIGLDGTPLMAKLAAGGLGGLGGIIAP